MSIQTKRLWISTFDGSLHIDDQTSTPVTFKTKEDSKMKKIMEILKDFEEAHYMYRYDTACEIMEVFGE